MPPETAGPVLGAVYALVLQIAARREQGKEKATEGESVAVGQGGRRHGQDDQPARAATS
jgi:hypothetical protein